MTDTGSFEEQNIPFFISKLKTYVPYAVTVTVAPGVLTQGAKPVAPGPLTRVQVPVPITGALPVSVEMKVPQRC